MAQGTVLRMYSNFADVAIDAGDGGAAEVVTARFRGRLMARDASQASVLVVGDRVEIDRTADGCVIAAVETRRTKLSRRQPGRSHREQVIAANVDQVLVVAACTLPPLREGLVDRYLVAASAEGLRAALCLTKRDLVEPEGADEQVVRRVSSLYRGLGVPVFEISREWPDSVQRLRDEWLAGKATLLVGQSGTGKTTLRNALLGERPPAATGAISDRTGHGKHVTSAATFEILPPSGFLVDTPGVREFGVWHVPAGELTSHFPEFADASCRFDDCRHATEPGCGARALVESGAASPARFASLRAIAESLEATD